MTRLLDRRDGPRDLRGRSRPDRGMSVLKVLVDRYIGVVAPLGTGTDNVARPDPEIRLIVSHKEVVAADEDVVRLTLQAPDGTALPSWHPGAHIDVHLESGRRRQYSLCGDPADAGSYVVAVRRVPDGGGGSLEMHALQPGDTVTVRGPRNGFPFVADGPALFVAGGIGITPILAMTRAAELAGTDWLLVYTGRSRSAMPFVRELEQRYGARVFIRPDDEYGIPTAADLLAAAPIGGAVYCCGPTSMLDAVRTGFDDTDARALHFERFGAPPIVDGRPFEVQLASTGEVLPVSADESALDVIRRHRTDVAYSCRQGFCGTCRTRVLSGNPDHRDNRLTDDERREEMLVCVSRADGRLVLDL
ncbi:MAG TPA: PDR/VanB family oxidoreductase [Rhodococcus sp. (in: high G+C Gram-positive bacteria)]|nr:PDR/VanB family oxidoreductase [Rhodococcus sp. (in: high G+C Gram-positive bacteria)]